jgi:hypothetical protein
MALGFLDILGPFFVIRDGVDAQSDHPTVSRREFRFETCHVSQLGCANRGEILWVRKQNRPPVADPFMKIDGTFRRLRSKIRSFFSDMKCHGLPPCKYFF